VACNTGCLFVLVCEHARHAMSHIVTPSTHPPLCHSIPLHATPCHATPLHSTPRHTTPHRFT
jgi:hypothetical protein